MLSDSLQVEVVDPDALVIAIVHDDDTTLVTVRGEIDMASSITLQTALDTLEPGRHVVVDCTDVLFMDSTGLRVVLLAQIRMDAHGGSLHIRRASIPVRLVIETSGLGHILEPDS